MTETESSAQSLPDQDAAHLARVVRARAQWTPEHAESLQTMLGHDACRRLAIYALPKDFCLSVIVPVYNEAKTIESVVMRLEETGLPMQIILVDDGSTDGTSDRMREIERAYERHDRARTSTRLQVCQHEKNRGKGAAIRTGIVAAQGEIIVIQDADQEYDPSDFRYLMQPILRGEADVAYGTRYGHYDRQLSPLWHQAVNALLSFLASVAVGIRLSDVETCYKMARREYFQTVLPDLQENRFGIEIELTARFARRGLRFTERPIHYRHRWYDEGKKIGWRDGVSALRCIAKYGLLRR